MKTVTFYNKTKQSVVGDAINIAQTSRERRVGLLKHEKLDDGEGLWIAPCEAIHTFWMKFAIDIVFLDKNLKVVKITPRLKPSRMSMSLRARSVLELAAGAAERKGIEPGDVLEKREAEAEG